MPNLVVYVPADVARALEVQGVSENMQRLACREVLTGLADDGLGRGDAVSTAGGGVTDTAPVRKSPRVGSSDIPAPPPSPGVERSFRPDPKKGK
jgi:hypothetical protein